MSRETLRCAPWMMLLDRARFVRTGRDRSWMRQGGTTVVTGTQPCLHRAGGVTTESRPREHAILVRNFVSGPDRRTSIWSGLIAA
jgi:hypothetical protein